MSYVRIRSVAEKINQNGKVSKGIYSVMKSPNTLIVKKGHTNIENPKLLRIKETQIKKTDHGMFRMNHSYTIDTESVHSLLKELPTKKTVKKMKKPISKSKTMKKDVKKTKTSKTSSKSTKSKKDSKSKKTSKK